MNDKITIQDIIELLAEKHSMDKKDAELFVKGMFDLIEEALASEKYVKVKGLGTFKLTDVDSRESVNVNTGERFEIQGHTKISFTPDASIRDLINKPFAHFETVILNESTALEDTETEIEGEDDKEEGTEEVIAEVPETTETVIEVVEIESPKEEICTPEEEASQEIEEIISTDEESDVPEPEITSEEEELIPAPVEIVEEPTVDENSEITVASVTADQPAEEDNIGSIAEESATSEFETMTIAEAAMLAAKEEKTLSETANEITDTEPAESIIPIAEKPEEKKKKKTDPLNFIIILLVLVIIGLAYWYFCSDNEPEAQTPATAIEQPKDTIPTLNRDTVSIKNDTIPVQATTTEVPAQTKQLEQTAVTQAKQPSTAPANKETTKAILADTVEYDITGTKTNYTLQEGESLIKVAIKFYGSKKFWPYIVQHNKGIIKDADRVPIGTTLRIPELTPKK